MTEATAERMRKSLCTVSHTWQTSCLRGFRYSCLLLRCFKGQCNVSSLLLRTLLKRVFIPVTESRKCCCYVVFLTGLSSENRNDNISVFTLLWKNWRAKWRTTLLSSTDLNSRYSADIFCCLNTAVYKWMLAVQLQMVICYPSPKNYVSMNRGMYEDYR